MRRTRLQLLYELAAVSFACGRQPSPQQLEVLKQALSRITLEELGIQGHSDDLGSITSGSCDGTSDYGCDSPALLPGSSALGPAGCPTMSGGTEGGASSMDMAGMSEALPMDDSSPRPPITYLHIHEDSKLSLGIFCLPARARIPLHNHPGMTVMSRVLYGQMHVQSCDWADPSAPEGMLPREAVKVIDDVFCSADDPLVLFPSSGGNIHQFTALTDCAVLDLMTPPYCTDEGRDCTYYRQVPGSGYPLRGEATLLDAFDPPDDFVIDHAEYHGCPVRPIKAISRLGGGGALPPGPGVGVLSPAGVASPTSTHSTSPRSATPPPSSAGSSPPQGGRLGGGDHHAAAAAAAALAQAQDMARGAAAALHGFA